MRIVCDLFALTKRATYKLLIISPFFFRLISPPRGKGVKPEEFWEKFSTLSPFCQIHADSSARFPHFACSKIFVPLTGTCKTNISKMKKNRFRTFWHFFPVSNISQTVFPLLNRSFVGESQIRLELFLSSFFLQTDFRAQTLKYEIDKGSILFTPVRKRNSRTGQFDSFKRRSNFNYFLRVF